MVCKSFSNNPGNDITIKAQLKALSVISCLKTPMLDVQTVLEQRQGMTYKHASGSSKAALGYWLLQSVCVSHVTNADSNAE